MGIVNVSNAVIPYLWEQRARIDRQHLVDGRVPAAPADPLRDPPTTPRRPASAPQGYGMTKWMVINQTRQMAQMLGVAEHPGERGVPGVTMSPATKAVVPEPIIDALASAAALGTRRSSRRT